ncbi:MAG: DUF4142 domain-containing protein [Sphingomonas sp.]|uniref:DUF4142 domain-containing protein n=1 Tax=Sphingomonas sp. TaxID=28214 RepID=UPI003F80044F
MTPRTCLLLVASACLVASCGDQGQGGVQRANSSDSGYSPTAPAMKSGNVVGALQNTASTMTPSAQDFANAAAASDVFEIESSKLALTNGQSSAVKDFARKMIEAHTQSTAKLNKAAASVAPTVTPDTTLAPDQRQKLDQLRAKKGADFDQQYVIIQRDAHQSALDALKTYAAKGDQPPLNAFANEMVPVVSQHLAMAKQLTP